MNALRLHRPIFLLVLSALCLSSGAHAQPCLRWVERTDVGSPGERRHHKMAYDSDRGVVVLFGGAAGDEYLQGTQEYDGTQWRQIQFAGVQPSHRAYHAMAYDADAHRVVMYGGFAGGVYGLDDTWTYQGDGVNGVWTLAFGNAANDGLAASAMIYDTARRQIIRYGGVTTPFEDPGGLEVPFFDTRTYEWRASTWVDSRATNGPALYGFGMAFDQRRGVAVVAGGFGTIDEEDRTDHVWEYTDRVSWADRGPTLPGRGYPAMAYDSKRGRIVMVGGDGGQGNTAIEYDPARGWVRLPDFPHFGRAGAGMAYDSRREKMVFMGGAGAGETFSDTWELETIPLTLTVSAPLTNQLICLGSTLNFYAFPSDSRTLSYQWKLVTDFADLNIPGATNQQFTITATGGRVRLRASATDLCGNVFLSEEISLFIHAPPHITAFDASTKYRCPGESFTLPVTATSTLEPVVYQWFFNDTAIDLATHPTLSLQTLAHENTGFYRVRVRNECGDTFSTQTWLQVGVTIPRQPTNVVADVCKTAGFSVEARGVGLLRYQWRLDGVPLANNAYFSGVTASNLTVRPCLYAYEGNYDVVVTDDCGSIHSVTSRVAKLTIKPGPEWVLRATNGPSARSEPAMAYDHERKVTLLFGGGQLNSGTFRTLGDLWEWDGARWLQRGTHSPSNGWTFSAGTGWQPSYSGQPVPRYQHSLVYDNIRRRFVLFGGQTRTPDHTASQIFLNDTWEWDGTTWHFRATNGPAPRSRPSMAFDSRRGVTVMTDGFLNTADPTPGAVWEWDGVSWQMRTPTNGPATNYSQDTGAMVYDSFHRKILFGPSVGEQYGWTFRSWDGTNWTTVFDNFVSQFFRQQYGDMAFDNYRRRAVWFGGQSGPSDTTGFFDGQNWEVLTGSPATPSPRYNFAMAYDTNRHATVMFGGETANQVFNGETWELIALDVPLINEQPASHYLQVGGAATLTVTARSPLGSPLSYRWFKNDQTLTDGGRISGAQTSQLRLFSTLASDVGEYKVQVSNDCGVATSLSAVLVQGTGVPALLAANFAMPIPGGVGNFVNLPQAPGFSGNNVAFVGIGSGGQQGIYLSDRFGASTSVRIADLNTSIPNGAGNFLSFGSSLGPGDPCISGSNVVFYGTGSGGQAGIYAYINNALLRVADTTTAIPSGVGTFTAAPTDPCISGGNVVFRGEGAGGQQGIYALLNGALVSIANTTTAIPGGNGNFTFIPTDPCISGDIVAFVGNGSGGQQGVYLSRNSGLSVVADTQTAIPGGAGNFTATPVDPCINGETVAFIGEGAGGQKGVYVKQPGDPCQFVADLGTAIPGGAGTFTGFGAVSISETDLAFLGHGVGGQTGIYDFVDDQLVKVVALGDSIGGKRITGLDFSRTGLWGDPIAFQATFDDGSEGIYTVDIIVPSILRMTSLERVGSSLRFRFKSVVGRNYIIQSCADLAAGNWADLPGPTIPGTGSMLQATVSLAAGEPKQFYRVKQLP